MDQRSHLAYLTEHCHSLKVLTFDLDSLDEHHCRVLGACSRSGLEIELKGCRIHTGVAAKALAEVLGRNQGPTKLTYCDMDYSILADGLRGNSRLNHEVGNRKVLAIADAVRENKGLVELNLHYRWSDETWGAICDSLGTHPTLEVLSLQEKDIHTDPPVPSAVLKSRIQALVDMLKVNMSIHTIHSDYRYSEHELFRGSVIPYLETNRLRSRVRAIIQKTRPIAYRAKVLGRALLSVRTDANSFWMLLSGNADVAFPSRTTTIAATSTADVATIAASVILLLRPLRMVRHSFYYCFCFGF
jgi:hypothetical protein